jgi:hypothetical protein
MIDSERTGCRAVIFVSNAIACYSQNRAAYNLNTHVGHSFAAVYFKQRIR